MKKKSISFVTFTLLISLTFLSHKSFAMPLALPNSSEQPNTTNIAFSQPSPSVVQSAIPTADLSQTINQTQPLADSNVATPSLAVDMGAEDIPMSPTTAISATPEVSVSATPNIPEELMATQTADTEDTEKNIFLNFDNADLTSFVNYIAEVKKLNLIPDKTLETAKISLSVRDPLSANGAWNVFLTVLEMAGFSIIKVGDVYKVIPKDQKLQQPLPVYINITPEQIPEDDSNCRFVTFLNNLSVTDYTDMVKSMLSDKGDVYAIKEVNGFIITDKCLNIRSAAKLLVELDQMGGAETATFIRLKNANAIDVKNLLDVLMKKPEVSPLARLLGKTAEGNRDYFPPGTRIIAEERLNALILVGDPAPIKKIEDFIVNYIDTALKEATSPLHVYELQYTDAQQIADLLKEATAPLDSTAGQAASKYGAIRGGVKYFRGMTFKVDKDGNRLVVSSTDKIDWKLLKRTIKDLDKPQPQVAIETMIITVNVSDQKELSGATRNKKHGQIGKNIDFQSAALTNQPSLQSSDSGSDPVSLLGNMISQITARQGLATATIGAASNIWSIFQALKTQTNTTLLSQPFLTVSNKTTARVKVGNEQRIIQEQTGDGLTGYESVTADTELIITPQINLEGLIRLDIETNINEFLTTDATQKVLRNLKTSVSVSDGQVLVLGGFVKTKTSETTYKTPLLGDIPILGWFFKSQNRKIDKEYLFIFLSPTILKPREIPGMNLYTKMKLHESTNDIEEGIQTKRTPDPVYNWYFNPEKENYSHKVIDFANARYQPTTVDIKNDPYYRAQTKREAVEIGELDEENGTTSGPLKQEPSPTKLVETQEPQSQNIAQQIIEGKIPETKIVSPIQDQAVQINTQRPALAEPPQTEPVQKLTQNETLEPLIEQGIVENLPIEPIKPKSISTQISNEITSVQADQMMSESVDDFKSVPDNTPISKPDNFGIDIKKRNRLKEFLSKNPMLSQNRNNKKRSPRRGLA